MEKPTAAHNPEVVGSSPAPATTKSPLFSWKAVIFFHFCNFGRRSHFLDTGVTQTVTHTGQKTGPEAGTPPPGLRAFGEILESLQRRHQDLFHGPGSLLLGRCRDVGVSVQGESCREVAQHAGDCLYIHPVLEGQGCEGVPQIWICQALTNRI